VSRALLLPNKQLSYLSWVHSHHYHLQMSQQVGVVRLNRTSFLTSSVSFISTLKERERLNDYALILKSRTKFHLSLAGGPLLWKVAVRAPRKYFSWTSPGPVASESYLFPFFSAPILFRTAQISFRQAPFFCVFFLRNVHLIDFDTSCNRTQARLEFREKCSPNTIINMYTAPCI